MKLCPAADSLTARGRVDGFGSQYSALVSVYAYAARSNRTFCATPWVSMAHGLDAARMFSFIGGAAFGPSSLLPILYAASSALIGTQSVVQAKAFSELMEVWLTGQENIWAHWLTYVTLAYCAPACGSSLSRSRALR